MKEKIFMLNVCCFKCLGLNYFHVSEKTLKIVKKDKVLEEYPIQEKIYKPPGVEVIFKVIYLFTENEISKNNSNLTNEELNKISNIFIIIVANFMNSYPPDIDLSVDFPKNEIPSVSGSRNSLKSFQESGSWTISLLSSSESSPRSPVSTKPNVRRRVRQNRDSLNPQSPHSRGISSISSIHSMSNSTKSLPIEMSPFRGSTRSLNSFRSFKSLPSSQTSLSGSIFKRLQKKTGQK